MIEFRDNGVSLRARWYEPDGVLSYPVVVIASGDAPGGSTGARWEDMIARLLARGIGCLAFDFEGLGHSDGTRRTLTLRKGIGNLRAALKLTACNRRADPSRVAGLGASFGANVLLLAAASEPALRLLALRSPCCFLAETFLSEFGSGKVEAWSRVGYLDEIGFDYQAFLDAFFHNTYEAASQLAIPVRVVHGSNDSVVPIRQSIDLMKFLKKGSMRTIEGAGHYYETPAQWDAMAEDLIGFIAEHIQ